MISSQKEREFKNSNYNDIKRVMSIWICMNMKEDSLDFYYLTNEKVMGSHEWKGKQDLIGIALIGIAKKLSEHKKQHELHRLLGALLSNKLEIQRKFEIIEKEYKIPMNDDFRKDVAAMCNLSQGIEDEGYERGYDSGYSKANEKMIMRSYKKGYTLEEIAELVDMNVEAVKAVIEEQETVVV